MNWLESMLYGIISGITEFLPISAFAHQQLYFKMLDVQGVDPLQSFLVHIALILAVLTGCRSSIEKFYRSKLTYRKDDARMRSSNNTHLELRFLKNAVLPMLLGYFVLSQFIPIKANLVWIAVFSFVNFLILMFQSRLMQGNKDERSVSIFDSLTIGLSAAVAVFPGISRVSTMLAIATHHGVDKEKAINWITLLSIPMLIASCVIDIFKLLTSSGPVPVSGNILGYILSAGTAYVFGYLGILLIKSYAYRKDISDFAYYSLGITFFTLFLYLTVV